MLCFIFSFSLYDFSYTANVFWLKSYYQDTIKENILSVVSFVFCIFSVTGCNCMFFSHVILRHLCPSIWTKMQLLLQFMKFSKIITKLGTETIFLCSFHFQMIWFFFINGQNKLLFHAKCCIEASFDLATFCFIQSHTVQL